MSLLQMYVVQMRRFADDTAFGGPIITLPATSEDDAIQRARANAPGLSNYSDFRAVLGSNPYQLPPWPAPSTRETGE